MGEFMIVIYDVVVVVFGYYFIIYIFDMKGIFEFNSIYFDIIFYFKYYCIFELFRNKKVIVVGNVVLGLDIVL